MRFVLRLLLGLVLSLLLGSASCLAEDDSGPVDGGQSSWIRLQLDSLGPDHVRLAVTASSGFYGTPLWRNSSRLGSIDIPPMTTVYATDFTVQPGETYTYIAGGHFLIFGDVWSEPLTVTVP